MGVDIETVVIGAGIIGLSIAEELSRCAQQVMVLERNARPGSETTSRNSQVIHAGLYYPPGSLRAKMCVEGKQRLYQFCKQHDVPFMRTGKLLIAPQEEDLPKLHAIAKNARLCGAGELDLLTPADVKQMAPQLQCEAALFSPTTGILDSHALMSVLEAQFQNQGGEIALHTQVENLERLADGTFRITTRTTPQAGETGTKGTTTVTSKYLVIAAGLHATILADKLHSQPIPKAGRPATDTYKPPRTYYAKGHYFTLNKPAPFENLIYPLPSKTGLGIHLTLGLDGSSRFGPDVGWTKTLDYRFEDNDGVRLKAFENAIRRYWPDLPKAALAPDSTGIRPRTYDQAEPVADFAIHGPARHKMQNMVALYGIESPGLTGALAIAPLVAKLLRTKP